jgi:hypothetical protein
MECGVVILHPARFPTQSVGLQLYRLEGEKSSVANSMMFPNPAISQHTDFGYLTRKVTGISRNFQKIFTPQTQHVP